MEPIMDKRAIATFLIFITLLLTSVAAIAYNKGYRPSFTKKGPVVEATGLLVATSEPDGAQVFLNNQLKTATNDTLNLPEDDYQIKIAKDGYITWEKRLKIKNGVVTETQARLFPTAPDLRAITSTGALSPTLSPDGIKLVYGIASGSAEKQGVWVADLTDRPLFTQNQSLQIAKTFSQATFTWSPDSKQIIAQVGGVSFLLDADRPNPEPQNITVTLEVILDSWDKEVKTRESQRISNLKPALIKELEKMKILAFSPDETKILYSASVSAILPPILEKPLTGASTQPEQREINKGSIYVYDIKEDKNFLITEKPLTSPSTQSLSWLSSSRHLVWVEEGSISILEYDGTNKATIYSGPFENSFVYPWPNGSKLIILTAYNRPAGVSSNLYTISLK